MFNNVFLLVKKQKKFINSIAKKFASAFTKQTAKLIEIVKAREEKQKTIPFQLFTLFNKSKL